MPLIQMTQEDIDEGRVGACKNCPVARAINRYLKPGAYASVAPSSIAILYSGSLVARCSSPEVASDFIFKFDGGGNPDPVFFNLDIPADCLKGASPDAKD